MHRTNLYLTPEQERALDTRARSEGVSRSELVRWIIDQELSKVPTLDGETEVVIASLSDFYEQATAGLFDEDPDLRIER